MRSLNNRYLQCPQCDRILQISFEKYSIWEYKPSIMRIIYITLCAIVLSLICITLVVICLLEDISTYRKAILIIIAVIAELGILILTGIIINKILKDLPIKSVYCTQEILDFEVDRESHIRTKQMLTLALKFAKSKPNRIVVSGDRKSVTQNYLMNNIYQDEDIEHDDELSSVEEEKENPGKVKQSEDNEAISIDDEDQQESGLQNLPKVLQKTPKNPRKSKITDEEIQNQNYDLWISDNPEYYWLNKLAIKKSKQKVEDVVLAEEDGSIISYKNMDNLEEAK